MHIYKTLKSLLYILTSKSIIKRIYAEKNFRDGPPFFYYVAEMAPKTDYYDAKGRDLYTHGGSFTSKYKALLMCLYESIKRMSLFSYKYHQVVFLRYQDFDKNEAINPSIFTNNKQDENRKWGWIKANDLFGRKKVFIPAQLIFFSYITSLFYDKNIYEPTLSETTTLDASIGSSHEETILCGVYEKIAQDAAMTIYLNKIVPPRVNTDTITDKEAQNIIHQCKRYGLEIFLFDITHDFNIPTFMSIIIDKKRAGPAVTSFVKTNLDKFAAIRDSLEQALMWRLWTKNQIILRNYPHKSTVRDINNKFKRVFYWSLSARINKLKYLLDQKPEMMVKPGKSHCLKNALTYVLKKLSEKNINLYYVDITPKILKETEYKIYKIIIPELQPRYINENCKELRSNRLKEVSLYFGQKKNSLNKIPHPFI